MQADIKQFMQVDQQQLKERQHRIFLRVRQVAELLSCGESTVWMWSRQKLITPIRLSPKVTVWSEEEILAFVQSRMNIA
ncbi:helix-turn-helix domain-containing protein [Sulfuricurvum sp.]|uniref:helix-turn-helix transcriptional regulator n=1 Tax=Sulfuricurvum sp. TaxID=2025608 RepID=UPI0026102544|nr:helix-turn-helix domain-containing protein [Sulfuricurvum sp.]MDD3597885.1 AlpA family phage regulatory protein [Sulfuricurvum sp.]